MTCRPDAPVFSPAAKTADRLSEGWAGSLDRYVSLKSRYRIKAPLAKAARSGRVLWAVSHSVAPFGIVTACAVRRAITQGSAVHAPKAQPTLSRTRRLTSWTTSPGSASERVDCAQAAKRSALTAGSRP